MNETMDRQNCLVLNFTGDSYHWGCHCTSLELYDSLIERGYYVNYRTVTDTHSHLLQVPQELNNFDSFDMAQAFSSANPSLVGTLAAADVVVVNGEGTLHRHHAGPWNLLYVMHFAKKYLQKKVHLINHSSYPSGGAEESEAPDALYKGVLQNLDLVASREVNSTSVLKRLGLNVVQSFDCLPRYIHRHKVTRKATPDGPIIVAGGVSLSQEGAAQIAEGLETFVSAARPAIFIGGAKNAPAQEEKRHFDRMHDRLPALQWIEAQSAREWLAVIGGGSVMVSARFHHTIAAASMLTPVVCLPSNTPKIDGICAMFGIDPPISEEASLCAGAVAAGVEQALAGISGLISEEKWAEVLSLGEQNFKDL